jgi:hypothetical protein
MDWPPVLNDRCETNLVPFGEVWSAATALLILAAGAVPLLACRHCDDEVSGVAAVVALNGVASAAAHSTLWRVFGRADALSINVFAVLYLRALASARFPSLAREPRRRAVLHLAVGTKLLLCSVWTRCNLPPDMRGLDVPLLALVPCLLVGVVWAVRLGTRDALACSVSEASRDHVKRVNRVGLAGTAVFAVGLLAWLLEERAGLGCGALTLHSLWHACSAHALMGWVAFLSHHRARVCGVGSRLVGPAWAPVVVWDESL